MTTTRWTTALALVLGILVAATGCSKKQVQTTPDRDRMDPVAATDSPTDDTMDDTGTVTREEALAMIGDMIFFDFDKSDLRPEARTTLQQKSEILRQYPDIRVRIEGHADERGTVEYNLALGERRADSARSWPGRLHQATRERDAPGVRRLPVLACLGPIDHSQSPW